MPAANLGQTYTRDRFPCIYHCCCCSVRQKTRRRWKKKKQLLYTVDPLAMRFITIDSFTDSGIGSPIRVSSNPPRCCTLLYRMFTRNGGRVVLKNRIYFKNCLIHKNCTPKNKRLGNFFFFSGYTMCTSANVRCDPAPPDHPSRYSYSCLHARVRVSGVIFFRSRMLFAF